MNSEIEMLRAECARLRQRVAELEAMLPVPEMAAAEPNKADMAFLERCRALIDQNLRNEKFTVDTLTSAFAMSHSSLYKKIRALTGRSIMDFISERRIAKARQCFIDGNANVAAVADICGYKDIKTFRACFKRHTGLNPKQFCLKATRLAP